jgi:hypothetical protein
MFRPDPATLAADAASTDPARALIARQLEVLTRLTDIGMGIAEDAGRRSSALADGGAAGANAPDPALAYARAARAVRMTIALQSRLLKDLADLDRAETQAHASLARLRRNRVHRAVERAVEAACDDEDEAERLSSDAWECLADTDDADITGRSFDEVVAMICQDLGLSPDEALPPTQLRGGGSAGPRVRPQVGPRINSAGDGGFGALRYANWPTAPPVGRSG